MTSVRVTDLNSSHVSTNKNWKKLSSLWEKVSKHQGRNQRLEARISTFFEETKQQVEQHEIQTCELMANKVERLIGFIARKTITGERRQILYEMILQELSELEANPFWTKNTAELRERFHDQISSSAQVEAQKKPEPEEVETQMFADMLETMLGIDIDLSHEKLAEMMRNPQNMEQYIDEIVESHQEQQLEDNDSTAEDDADNEFFERAFNQFNEDNNAPSVDDIQTLFRTSDLSKLYKKMATKLHPDKETDESNKKKKHELMQQLSKAKREGDIFTLLQMSQQWLPEFELDLSPAALKVMIRVLETKVTRLNAEHKDLSSDTSLQGMVWNRFSARSKKQRQQNIQQHIDSLADSQSDIQAFMDSLMTVKAMNAYLKERETEDPWLFTPF